MDWIKSRLACSIEHAWMSLEARVRWDLERWQALKPEASGGIALTIEANYILVSSKRGGLDGTASFCRFDRREQEIVLKNLLLSEGVDLRYGARYLKRAIDRLLVHPLSALMASNQIAAGNIIAVDPAECREHLEFSRESEMLTNDAAASPAAKPKSSLNLSEDSSFAEKAAALKLISKWLETYQWG